MELTLICVVGVVSIVLVAALSRRIGVAAPLSLVVVGAALSFLPSLPKIEVNPEWILAGVLPPLLYASAVRMPANDFRRDFKAIVRLAVVLVVLTTLCAGLFFDSVLPALGLGAAFALGAVISPTDAVAATSVGKRLGLPSRLLTILEGEGLVNDATSLVLLSSAVAAMSASTVHLWKVGADFLYSVLVAALVGFAVGLLNVRVRGMLKDTVLNTAVSFVVPFVAFIPAEELHASGVLAVVVTGLVTGHLSARHLRAQDRITEAINWSTVSFMLECGVFLLMGLELRTALVQSRGSDLSVTKVILIGLAACLLAIVLRILFVGPLVAKVRRDADRAENMQPALDEMQSKLDTAAEKAADKGRWSVKRVEAAAKRLTQRRSDMDFLVAEKFGWRGGAVLAWAGMRGAVTVAAAQSLPTETPNRPQLLLIAFVVAIVTLLLQGLTLPWVIQVVKVPGDDAAEDRAEYGRLLGELMDVARQRLNDPELRQPNGEPYAPVVLQRARGEVGLRAVPGPEAGPQMLDYRGQYRQMMIDVLGREREVLLDVRSVGSYSSRVLTRASEALDLEEARLQRLADSSD